MMPDGDFVDDEIRCFTTASLMSRHCHTAGAHGVDYCRLLRIMFVCFTSHDASLAIFTD